MLRISSVELPNKGSYLGQRKVALPNEPIFRNGIYSSGVSDTPLIVEPLQNAPSWFVVYVSGDQHLDNHFPEFSSSSTSSIDTPNRINFYFWLKSINDSLVGQINKTQAVLVLNGDVFDFDASWSHDFEPYDELGKISDIEKTNSTINEIFSNNQLIVNELRWFLQMSKHTRIVYILGNHDKVFLLDSLLQKLVLDTLMPNEAENEQKRKILFANAASIPELGLYLEHGHRMEPIYYDDEKFCLVGDWFEFKIHYLIRKVQDSMAKADIPNELKETLTLDARRIEFILPSSYFLDMFVELLDKYHDFYKPKDKKIADEIKKVKQTYRGEVGKILQEYLEKFGNVPSMIVNNPLSRVLLKSKLAGALATRLITSKDPNLNGMLSRKNNDQKSEGKRLSDIMNFQIFSGAHTHVSEISDNGFLYTNMGEWKPVTHVKSKDDGLEYANFTPSGELKLETDLTKPRRIVNYFFDARA
ncbi:MAG: metallophosphoesterase [Candidatus Melainabacteria bacterium]|nr:metallophosphoesterase [Candidatus Melainabacteria bacterium]